MDVDKLTLLELDKAVAEAQGWVVEACDQLPYWIDPETNMSMYPAYTCDDAYSPTTNEEHGKELIQEYNIDVYQIRWPVLKWEASCKFNRVWPDPTAPLSAWALGSTRFVAAAKAFVCSR